MKKIPIILAFLFLYSTQLVVAQDLAVRIDDLMSKYDSLGFSGAILVSDGGEVIYRKSFGYANREWNIPNTPETRFRIGSLTKAFTAALVLRLVEEGLLRLDASVTTYFPDYPNPYGSEITLHHLLTHSSGIPSYTRFPDFLDIASKSITPTELISFFSSKELVFPPGSRQRYSNSGYALVGAIVEAVTDMRYADALQKWVLDPLNLSNTGVDTGQVVPNFASGYVDTYGGYEPAPYWHPSMAYSAGSMYSTLDDLHRWVKSLAEGRLFSTPETFEEMTTVQFGDNGYGWVVRVDSMLSPTPYGIYHNGGFSGFSGRLEYNLLTNSTLIFLENVSGGATREQHGLTVANSRRGQVTRGIQAIINNEIPNEPKASIGRLVASIIESESLDSAINTFRQIRSSESEVYQMDSFQLAILSYHYLNAGAPFVAKTLAELNVEYYPLDAVAYVGLVSALLSTANREEALKTYEQMLETESSRSLPLVLRRRLEKSLGISPVPSG